MRGEGWRRVRWANVGRAAAMLAVLAVVIAWPRLEPDAPKLPSDAATPVATATVVPRSTPGPRPPRSRVIPRSAPARGRPERHRRTKEPSRRHARPPRPQATLRPVPPPVATPRAVPAATQPPDPAVREFSFEVG